METFTGFVKKIATKEGRGRNGKPWKLYSVKMEDENGVENDKWLSAGFDKPPFNEGDYVKVIAEENDKGYLNITESKKLKNPPAQSSASAVSGKSGNVGKSNSTQTSIHYQSARKDAIEVLKLLQAQDALPLSSAKTKAGEAKRFEELMALVDKLTVQYFNDAETHRILDSVADAGAIDTDVGSIPEDNNDDDEEEDSDSEEDDE